MPFVKNTENKIALALEPEVKTLLAKGWQLLDAAEEEAHRAELNVDQSLTSFTAQEKARAESGLLKAMYPAEPETPAAPSEPAEPVDPSTPKVPEQPEVSAQPKTPAEPAVPSEPATPADTNSDPGSSPANAENDSDAPNDSDVEATPNV